MANKISSPLTVLRFSCWHFSDAMEELSYLSLWVETRIDLPSLVINEMNSLTHSCMHSLASFAIFAFSGRANFMMRATRWDCCQHGSSMIQNWRMKSRDKEIVGQFVGRALLAP